VEKFPSNKYRWKPGQSGNPAGSSKGRRITSAVVDLIESQGLSKDLGLTVVLMALGDTAKLAAKGRAPDLGWFRLLCTLLGEDQPVIAADNVGDDIQALRDFLKPRRKPKTDDDPDKPAKRKPKAKSRGKGRKAR
jgi:hypothetical protein